LVDHAITIKNNLIVVGYNPVSAWGTLVWGTDSWRFNGEIIQDVGKPINFGSTTLSDLPIKDIEHLSDLGSTLLSDSISKGFTRAAYNNTVTSGFEITEAYLTDKNGYYYTFIGGVIDADERGSASWNKASSTTSTWVTPAAVSSIWS